MTDSVPKITKGVTVDVQAFEFIGTDGHEWSLVVGDKTAFDAGMVLRPLKPCFMLRADAGDKTLVVCVPNRNSATLLAAMFEEWSVALRDADFGDI